MCARTELTEVDEMRKFTIKYADFLVLRAVEHNKALFLQKAVKHVERDVKMPWEEHIENHPDIAPIEQIMEHKNERGIIINI
jgi:hypothetical protein